MTLIKVYVNNNWIDPVFSTHGIIERQDQQIQMYVSRKHCKKCIYIIDHLMIKKKHNKD